MTNESQEMNRFTVQITFQGGTGTRLREMGFSLYAFKAVRTARVGRSTVWFRTDKYSSQEANVSWAQRYQAYVSNDQIQFDSIITPASQVDILLGTTWQVDSVGQGPVVAEGRPFLSISNTGNRPWPSAGIMQGASSGLTMGTQQKFSEDSGVLCAFPLHINEILGMIPEDKVLLMFSIQQLSAGTVVAKSFAPALMVDLTGATRREVSFDLDKSWDWGSFSWGQQFPAHTDLAPLLIKP